MSQESKAVARAILAGDYDKARLLCSNHGPQLRASGELQWLFWYAACLDDTSALDLLHAQGAEVNALLDSHSTQTALYSAAGEGAVSAVGWLLEHGADVNCMVEGELRCLPLFVAIREGHERIVRLLVEAGAIIRTVWNDETPVQCARSRGHERIAEYLTLIEKPA